MRSRLTWSKPASRDQSTTAGTRNGSWVRSRVASTDSTADCIPKLTRVKPASRSAARSQAATLSGLASVVTSAPGASPNSAAIAASTDASSPGPSRVGVPPPKNTVSTGRSRSPSTRRACRTSAIAASAYVAREAPGWSPSSSAV